VDAPHRPEEPTAAPTTVPTGAPWPPVGSSAPSARRPWPWIVAVLLLAAVAAGAAAVAWHQRGVAAEWRDRAVALEEQRDEAAVANEVLRERIDEAVAVLELSEQDVAALEERLRQLGGEIAQVQDEATTIRVERDVLVDVSGEVRRAVDALDVCVTRLFDLLNDSIAAYNAAAAGESVDVDPLNAASRSTTSFCNDARSAAAGAAAAADRMLGR
jgi:uncharacterized protein HemX